MTRIKKPQHDSKMQKVTTIEAKHIFIDVVNYTHNRSVEAQTEIINSLNKVVIDTAKHFKLSNNMVLYIPTGDGMCITLLDVFKPYDIHVQIGLMLLEKIAL